MPCSSAATSAALAAGDVERADVGQLAHPGELAPGVAARAGLHRLDVAGEQLLEAERLAGGGRRARGVGARGPPRRRRRRPSRRRGGRCASRSASRSITSPASSVGWRVSRRPQLRVAAGGAAAARPGVEQLERADEPLAVGRRDALGDVAARGGVSSACSASGPRAASCGLPPRAGPAAAAGAGRARPARRAGRGPVPPTTIGRRPAASARVDLRVRERRRTRRR